MRTISENRLPQAPAQELATSGAPPAPCHISYSDVWRRFCTTLRERRSIPGPFPTDGATSFTIVYLQIAVTDVVVVLPPRMFYPTTSSHSPTGLPNVPHLRQESHPPKGLIDPLPIVGHEGAYQALRCGRKALTKCMSPR